MTYLKTTAVGIVTAVIFGAAWTWAALQIPIWWQMWQQRNHGGGTGASMVGFVLGFALKMWRAHWLLE